MTPAQTWAALAVPVDSGVPGNRQSRRQQRQAEIFQAVCLKHQFPPERLSHFSIEDIGGMVREIVPKANIDPQTLRASLNEFLESNANG